MPKKTTRAKPKSHLRGQLSIINATPVGHQPDLFDGPDVPVYLVTSAALALKLMRTEIKLSGVACARACGLTRETWESLETGALLLTYPTIELSRIQKALRIEKDRILMEMA